VCVLQWASGLQGFDICRFENFVVISFVFSILSLMMWFELLESQSQPVTDEELEDLAALLT
jgi:hypothetical protein